MRFQPLATVCLTLSCLLPLTACGSDGAGASTPGTPYTPPAVTAAVDGLEAYVDAPMIDKTSAQSLDPILDSPEAAAVKFLSSRVRGDSAWKAAMKDDLSDRGQRGLKEWEEWQLQRFQLRGRQASGSNNYWIKIYFEIVIDGSTDDGEDDLGVTRDGDGWRVFEVPS